MSIFSRTRGTPSPTPPLDRRRSLQGDRVHPSTPLTVELSFHPVAQLWMVIIPTTRQRCVIKVMVYPRMSTLGLASLLHDPHVYLQSFDRGPRLRDFLLQSGQLQSGLRLLRGGQLSLRHKQTKKKHGRNPEQITHLESTCTMTHIITGIGPSYLDINVSFHAGCTHLSYDLG